MLKKLVFASSAIIIIISGIFWWYRSAQASSVGSLTIYQGGANILREEKTETGQTGAKIRIGDAIAVAPGGRIAIILKDGSHVRFEAGTIATIAKIAYDQHNHIRTAVFRLQEGKIWSRVEPLSPKGDFRVETPTVVAAVRGTAFNVGYAEEKSEIQVFHRRVQVALQSNLAQEATISGGQKIIILNSAPEESFALGPVAMTFTDINDWITFNFEEDRRVFGESEAERMALSAFSPSPTPPPSSSATSTPSFSPLASSSPNLSKPSATPAKPPSLQSPSSLPPSPTPSESLQVKTIVSLSLMPTLMTIPPNESQRIQALATYSDGLSADVTAKVIWHQQPIIGTISTTGMFTGTTEGQTRITATLNGKVSNEILITVENPKIQNQKTLTGVTVNCMKSPNTHDTFQQLPQMQCTARAMYSDDSALDVTDTASWNVLPGGTANGRITQNGLYTAGFYQGNDTVQASFEGKVGTFILQFP